VTQQVHVVVLRLVAAAPSLLQLLRLLLPVRLCL